MTGRPALDGYIAGDRSKYKMIRIAKDGKYNAVHPDERRGMLLWWLSAEEISNRTKISCLRPNIRGFPAVQFKHRNRYKEKAHGVHIILPS
jgi:hypothetical protein